MKSSRLNPLLLVFSILCLMFGLYGFLFGGRTEAPPTANSVSVADFTGGPAETVPDEPASRPAPTVKQTEPQPEVAPEPQEKPKWQGSITGIVVDANAAPIEGVEVVVTDMEQQGIEDGQHRTSTDKDGRFRVSGLNPIASFNVVASSQIFGKIGASGVLCGSDVRLVFDAIGVLKVRLLDEQGNPLNHASLRHHRVSARIGYGRTEWALAHGKDGNYSVGWHWSFQWVRFTARGYLPSRQFTVDDLKIEGLEVRLLPACQLSGTVTDLEGKPLQYATVLLRACKEPDGNELELDDFIQSTRRTTNSDGCYQFDSLPHGTYTINAYLLVQRQTTFPTVL